MLALRCTCFLSALFELRLHLTQRPLFTRRQNPNRVVLVDANQRMGTKLIVDTDQGQIALWPPVQRDVEVAGKDLPLRSVVQFHKMTFRMLAYFHASKTATDHECSPADFKGTHDDQHAEPLWQQHVAALGRT